MKSLKSIILILAAMTLTILASCSSDDGDNPVATPDEQLLSNGGKAWTMENDGSAQINGLDITHGWIDFSILIKNDGTYSTSGSSDLEVWPTNGGWVLADDHFVRSDGIIINYTVTSEVLELSFNYNEEGRLTGIEGGYEFNFSNK